MNPTQFRLQSEIRRARNPSQDSAGTWTLATITLPPVTLSTESCLWMAYESLGQSANVLLYSRLEKKNINIKYQLLIKNHEIKKSVNR